MKKTVLLVAFALSACGGQTELTPDLIGRRAFEFLKADNFPGFYTTLVATPEAVKATCQGLSPGLIDRYFETGEGSQRQQQMRFIECRAAIDFGRATLTGVQVLNRSNELAPPECVQPILNTDVVGTVTVDGTAFTFTVGGVMQFLGGWRIYKRLRDCRPVAP